MSGGQYDKLKQMSSPPKIATKIIEKHLQEIVNPDTVMRKHQLVAEYQEKKTFIRSKNQRTRVEISKQH